MRPSTRSAAAALVVVGALTGCPRHVGELLLRPAQLPGAKPPDRNLVMRSREVTVEFSGLRPPGAEHLAIPTFGNEVLRVIRDRTEEVGKGGFVWHGHVENEPGSSVTFAVKGEVLIGNITTQRGKVYQIRYLDRGIHRFQQIDPSKFPPEGEPEQPTLHPSPEAETCSSDPPTDIDVLVVYTDDARVAVGGSDAMEATVYLAVSETNQAYLNSNINQRIRLAHVEEVSYSESGVSMTDRNALQNPSDGILDNVQTLRNTFAADAVVLITESLENCGRAYIMNPVSNAFEPFGFAVVRRDCATGNYSFGHELGHIMGARHDWVADPTNNSPYVYNHGHLVTAPADPSVAAWRTIMSVNSSCGTGGCIRVQYWSNPFINFPPGGTTTDPMGTSTGAQQTDNHQTLNNTALTVANFRCSSPGAPNVWMKDTWDDTGREPDPNTVGEAMWRSPYIWVRITQDITLVHQHEHQNPEFGSTNWVYVKLHNGATTAASGNLEIYYADASASLTWPTAWTLIGSVPVTSFAAKSSRVVEQQWSGVPSPGHYCLIARWVSSADPMTTPEGTDIGANVRNNNNLVWRNVNIVDLTTPDQASDASLIIRNLARERVISSIWIRGPRDERQPSFLAYGEVSVRLDSGLTNAWKKGGARGTGYKSDAYGLRVSAEGARLDSLVLPPAFEGRVFVRMHRLPSTPRRDFGLDVVHAIGERTIGGVSYEIHTDIIRK